jgi:signal transduction histidine kinase
LRLLRGYSRDWGNSAKVARLESTLIFALLILSLALFPVPAMTAGKPKHVLVIYAASRLLPAILEADRGLLEALTAADPTTELSAEFLDYPRFDAEPSNSAVIAFLRGKYALRQPDVVVAGGKDALAFLLHNRAALFPSTPMVHMAVSVSFMQTQPTPPPDVVGVPVDYDFSGTIEQALRWRPQARRLIVVTGAAAVDRELEPRLRNEFSRLQDRVAIEFLSGLPTSAVLQQVGNLGEDAVVFTPGYFEDGEGRTFVPRETARMIAEASKAPVFGPFSTFIGAGIVGGRMVSYDAIGRQAGEIVNQLLRGVTTTDLRLPTTMPTLLNVDWRQIKRWGINEKDVPGDAIVHFREPNLWETHKAEIVFAISAFVALIGSVIGLLIERRLRLRAELAEVRHRSNLVRAMRFAIAGELTGSIAHEINQPLGAIMSNVAAAELMLGAAADRREELRAVLSDIRRDNIRASEVIRRLRTLFVKQDVEQAAVRIDEALSDVANILRAEAQRRKIALSFRQPLAQSIVLGDRVEIGQMVMNLVLNAMDAVADVTEDRRSVVVSTEDVENGVCISVLDRGHGITADALPMLFDSFFTTKQGGIGLGLSIVRTIVTAHAGRVWAENGRGGGAIFHVQLPVVASLKAAE